MLTVVSVMLAVCGWQLADGGCRCLNVDLLDCLD